MFTLHQPFYSARHAWQLSALQSRIFFSFADQKWLFPLQMSEELFICAFCKEQKARLRCSGKYVWGELFKIDRLTKTLGCKSAAYCDVSHQKAHWKEHKANCQPFKISVAQDCGRFLAATRGLAAQSFVYTELPIVVGPKWHADERDAHPMVVCVGCFTAVPFAVSTRCPKCHWPACRPDCPGLENEKLHKLECGVLAFGRTLKTEDPNAFKDFYRTDALLTLKCLMLQVQKPKKWQQIMALESHEKKRKGTKVYQ